MFVATLLISTVSVLVVYSKHSFTYRSNYANISIYPSGSDSGRFHA